MVLREEGGASGNLPEKCEGRPAANYRLISHHVIDGILLILLWLSSFSGPPALPTIEEESKGNARQFPPFIHHIIHARCIITNAPRLILPQKEHKSRSVPPIPQ